MKHFSFVLACLTLVVISRDLRAQETAANIVTVPSTLGQVRFVPAKEIGQNTFVLDRRVVRLASGRNVVNFSGIATNYNPQTMQLTSDNPAVRIVEQARFFTSDAQILARYIGQTLRLKRDNEEISGKLLSLSPTLFQTDKGVLLDPNGIWILPDVPAKASTTEGVSWTIEAPTAGDFTFTLRYAATGFAWNSLYRATLDERGETIDFSGWITIDHNNTTAWSGWRGATWTIGLGNSILRSPQPLDVLPGSARQVVLAASNRLPVTASTVLNATSAGRFLTDSSGALQTALRFQNSAQNGLGSPLPPGPFSLWQESSEGDPLLRAQGTLPLVGADETTILPLGESSGLSYTRSVTSRRLNPETREHSVVITLNNARNQAATVSVIENFPSRTTFGESEPAPSSKDGDEARWNLTLPANSNSEIRYSVQVKN